MSGKEAMDLLAQADKKAGSSGWFFGSNKQEEAADLYIRAGNSFKLAKQWHESGNAFYKAADMHMKLEELDDVASDYINASKSFRKCSPEEAVRALQSAIEIMTKRGRFYMAAGHQKTVAEIYESDIVNVKAAMEAYEIAAEWYSAEDATSLASNCTLKAAHFAAQLEQYEEAIKKFEAIAANSVDNQLTKWSLKEYFLKAGLCWLCNGDLVGARLAIERYCNMDVTFESTREYQFLKSLIEAIEEGDIEMFTDKVYEFDRLTKLDNWKTTMLLRIKRTITEETLT